FTILEREGAAFHYGTAATDLIQDQKGNVVGVRALTPEGFATFRAKSIVLACGSFEANPEMRARYLGPGWDMVHIRGVPFNTGDGLRMAMNIDAKARRMDLYPTNYETASRAKADTLEKLADDLGINVENLVRTVREFNMAIQPGEFNPDRHRLDGKCTAGITPKKSNYAMSIEEP